MAKLAGLAITPVITGTLSFQSSLPTNAHVLSYPFRYIGFELLVVTTAYSPIDPTELSGTVPLTCVELVITLGVCSVNVVPSSVHSYMPQFVALELTSSQ